MWDLHIFIFTALAILWGELPQAAECVSRRDFSTSICEETNGYHPVFIEEFNGNELNTSRWTVVEGIKSSLGRDAILTSDNVFVKDGALVISSLRHNFQDLPKDKLNPSPLQDIYISKDSRTDGIADADDDGSTNDPYVYTSGAVISQGKAAWKYGRFCINAILPGFNDYGNGIWPAHWMMPDDNSCWPDEGEIDIMEMVNGNEQVSGTLHWSNSTTNCSGDNNDAGYFVRAFDWNRSFHEYAVEWEEGYISFFLDGMQYASINSRTIGKQGTNAKLPQVPFYLLLNTAIGGFWPLPPDENTAFPSFHQIDYVKVFQKKYY